jgi:hypothetical protein
MIEKRYLTCNLTGENSSFSEELYTKKILQYGGEENLKKFFIKGNIVTLLSKGYDVKESSKLLSFVYDEEKEPYYKELIKFYNSINAKKKVEKTSDIIETDDDVKDFINAWKHKLA